MELEEVQWDELELVLVQEGSHSLLPSATCPGAEVEAEML